MSKDAEYQKEVLEGMLEEEENKNCADCGARGPRWCSTNIGVFLCIKCSGIHRKMGTHISKVKSVTLDKWTREQVDHFRKFGNRRANRKYLANCPDHIKPHPTDDFAMEQFIRDKYERKKWYKKGASDNQSAPPKQQQQPKQQPQQQQQQRVVNTPKPPSPRGNAPVAAQPQRSSDVGNFLNFNPTPVQQPQQPAQQPTQNPNELLFGLGTLGQQQQAPSISKDQLLSLYAKPMTPQPMVVPTLNPTNLQQVQQNKPNYNVRVGGAPMGTMPMGTMPMGTMPMGTMPMGTVGYNTMNPGMYYNPNQVVLNPLGQQNPGLYRN